MSKIFRTPLDQVCRKDKLTCSLHYIYFEDGFLYVTNGWVALKQKIELHGLAKRDVDKLHGYAIHKDVFKLINRQSDVKIILNRATPRDVYLEFEIGGGKFNVGLPRFIETPGGGKIVEQINTAFSTFEKNKLDEIAMNPEYVTLLSKVMIDSTGFTFRFNTKTGGILVTPNKNNIHEHAIIMPLRVTGEYNADGI